MSRMDSNQVSLFPELPRCIIGEFEILPKLDPFQKIVPGQWVFPGGKVHSTREAMEIAAHNNQPFSIREER